MDHTQKSQITLTNDALNSIINRAPNGAISLVKEKEHLFSEDTKMGIASLAGELLVQSYIDAYNKNGFENTARLLVIGASALIPYVGCFVSPIIGLLWPPPENVPESVNIEKLIEDCAKMINNEIISFDFEILSQTVKALRALTSRFEDLLNGNPLAKEYAEAGTIQETLRIKALNLNDKFIETLYDCTKTSYKSEELPIYTIVATAHLLFLNVVVQHGQGPRMQMDDETYKMYVKDLKELPEKYTDHIKKTSEPAVKKLQKQMDLILDAFERAEDQTRSSDEHKNLENMFLTLEYWRIEASKSQGAALTAARARRDALSTWVKEYKDLVNAKTKYVKGTVDNQAFNMAVALQGGVFPGIYKIVSNLDPNKVVDMRISDKNALLWTYKDGDNQQWELEYFTAKNAYRIINQQSPNNVLAYSKNSTSNKVFAAIKNEQYEDQYWTLENAGDGYFFLKNLASPNLVLDVTGSITQDGAQIIVYEKHSNSASNQKFKFEKREWVRPGTYKIWSKLSYYKVVQGKKTTKTAELVQTTGGLSEQWELKYFPDKRAYMIINKFSSTDALVWSKPSTSNKVFLYTKSEQYEDQYWIVEETADSYFVLRNLASPDMVLDVAPRTPLTGEQMIVHKYNSGESQQFRLEKIGSSKVRSTFTLPDMNANENESDPRTPFTIEQKEQTTWDSNKEYNEGDRVLYNGNEYEAKYWTQGNQPDISDHWKLISDVVMEWNTDKEYTAGDKVHYQGTTYQAKWWTKGDIPSETDAWENKGK